jgi:hypothetical protein
VGDADADFNLVELVEVDDGKTEILLIVALMI